MLAITLAHTDTHTLNIIDGTNVHVIMSMTVFAYPDIAKYIYINYTQKRDARKSESGKFNCQRKVHFNVSLHRITNRIEQHIAHTYTNGSFTKDAKKLMKNGCQCMTTRRKGRKTREKQQ